MSQITVRISPTGQVTINVLNTEGSSCSTLTNVSEQALGEPMRDGYRWPKLEVDSVGAFVDAQSDEEGLCGSLSLQGFSGWIETFSAGDCIAA